ncbi:hypothetical protein JMUB5695_01541 [Mycobacterium heckeshornense]|nr:hypothetical protein JMUB5695_01541 [Mycobacterium heckeshornense]
MLQPSWLAVLVGIEGSQASELATASAFDEASFRGVELVTLHAWSGADSSIPPFLELRLAMEKTLAEALTDFQERYPDVSLCRRVVFDHPARTLLEQLSLLNLLSLAATDATDPLECYSARSTPRWYTQPASR